MESWYCHRPLLGFIFLFLPAKFLYFPFFPLKSLGEIPGNSWEFLEIEEFLKDSSGFPPILPPKPKKKERKKKENET